MFCETSTYVDYNGISRTEKHYFNISKAEIADMQLSTPGGYAEMLQTIIDHNDGPTVYKAFRDFILKAYGVKSEDGKRFIKSEEITAAFMQTEAYSEFMMKLLSDSDYAAKFINMTLPAPNNDPVPMPTNN